MLKCFVYDYVHLEKREKKSYLKVLFEKKCLYFNFMIFETTFHLHKQKYRNEFFSILIK